MDTSYNSYDKISSIDWNGQYFVLTARDEITGNSFSYAYSADGMNWTTSIFPSNITTQNPYSIKSLGDKFVAFGDLVESSNSCLVNIIDGAYPVAVPTNLSNTAKIYDIESNIEQPNRVVFPRTTVLALGNGSMIAYSANQGETWTASLSAANVFSNSANDAVWNGELWVVGGKGTMNTLATSLDGITWTGRGNYIFSDSCNGIDWSPQQRKYVAVGSGTNIVASSMDGIYWIGTNTSLFSVGHDIKWNGKIWVAVGADVAGNPKIAYSLDAINWNYSTI